MTQEMKRYQGEAIGGVVDSEMKRYSRTSFWFEMYPLADTNNHQYITTTRLTKWAITNKK